jgi:hypothetical protein
MLVLYQEITSKAPENEKARKGESPLLRMTKRRAFLRALSQNRISASRVSLCYGL